MKRRDLAFEAVVPALVVLACACLGAWLGWAGPGRTDVSTRFWPFYLDTWFPRPVFTWRALLPLGAAALAWPVVRAWLRAERPTLVHFACLVGAAYLMHVLLGGVRFGFTDGITRTFRHPQDYWNDAALVDRYFLARVHTLGLRLSLHGATHPPGLPLLLAGVRAVFGENKLVDTLLCTSAPALTILPLYGAARRLADERTARWAAALFPFACSIGAMAVLAMDVWTMLFATLAVYGFARALDSERAGGVVLGLSLAAASLCNYIALLLPLGFALVVWDRRAKVRGRILHALALGPFALFAVYAALMLALDYRPLAEFRANLAAFAGSANRARSPVLALLGNPVAFLGGLGLPLAGLCARAAGGAVVRVLRRTDVSGARLVLAAFVPPLVATALGTPRGEVEHIFLLFVPPVVLAGALAGTRWYPRSERWVLVTVTALIVQSTLIEVFVDTFW